MLFDVVIHPRARCPCQDYLDTLLDSIVMDEAGIGGFGLGRDELRLCLGFDFSVLQGLVLPRSVPASEIRQVRRIRNEAFGTIHRTSRWTTLRGWSRTISPDPQAINGSPRIDFHRTVFA